MSRQKRVNFIGYCYITNKGISNRVVYKEKADYYHFETLLINYANQFDFKLQHYSLIGSEYFLLIKTTKNNLSDFMRQINGSYSRYFNKKYQHNGHLWQDRFKSWYIQDENSLPSFIRYIEQKPFQNNTNMNIGEYSYSSARHFIKSESPNEWIKDTWIINIYTRDREFLKLFLNMKIDAKILRVVEKNSRKLKDKYIDNKINDNELEEFFHIDMTKPNRNIKILEAYNKGFSQYKIAQILSISQPAVNMIIKRLIEKA